MRTFTRSLIAACTVIASLALLTGAASALRSLSVSPGGAISASGVSTFAGGELQVICNLTLGGNLNRSVAKRAGESAGSVTEGRTENCRENVFGLRVREAVVLVEAGRPFAVTYVSFLGILPNITGVLFSAARAAFNLFALGTECLYEAARQGFLADESIAGGPRFNRITLLSGDIARFVRGGGACPPEGNVRARLTLSPVQTASLL